MQKVQKIHIKEKVILTYIVAIAIACIVFYFIIPSLLNYGEGTINTEFDKASNNNGYYTFLNERFAYLTSSKCYWLKNNHNTKSYAMIKESDTTSKIYEEINNECSIVPVIIARTYFLLYTNIYYCSIKIFFSVSLSNI